MWLDGSRGDSGLVAASMSETTMGGSQPVYSNSQAESEIVPAGVSHVLMNRQPKLLLVMNVMGGWMDVMWTVEFWWLPARPRPLWVVG